MYFKDIIRTLAIVIWESIKTYSILIAIAFICYAISTISSIDFPPEKDTFGEKLVMVLSFPEVNAFILLFWLIPGLIYTLVTPQRFEKYNFYWHEPEYEPEYEREY